MTLLSHIIPIYTAHVHTGDDCAACTHKLCCTVYSILDTADQWRTDIVVKKQWDICTHKNTDTGKCGIYDDRHAYKWYSRACVQYTCHNAGPIVDAWIVKNNIQVEGDRYLNNILYWYIYILARPMNSTYLAVINNITHKNAENIHTALADFLDIHTSTYRLHYEILELMELCGVKCR